MINRVYIAQENTQWENYVNATIVKLLNSKYCLIVNLKNATITALTRLISCVYSLVFF